MIARTTRPRAPAAKWPQILLLAVSLLPGLMPASAHSEDWVVDFRSAIARAVQQNPEVVASWYDFEASRDERAIARSGYLPRLDIEAQSGREKSRTPVRSEDRYGVDTRRLNVTQMLFDGFATRNEVRRLGHVSRTRYHELQTNGENVALDATTAYLDVLRRQTLVRMADENVARHREIFQDIQARTAAGVSRRVDLEQASARLALAETNLLIETANLHDVTARFQRVVGGLPADHLPEPELPTELIPEDPRTALKWAYRRSPRLGAARAGIDAARAELDAKTARLFPRIDLRVSRQRAEDLEGVEGHHDQTTAELVLSYNVFQGGADYYRRKQFRNRLSAARELRLRACREVRQTVVIAYNDTRSFEAQLAYLEQNELSIAKARRSYREQFSIGQRSLLDLLDSENEYFEIRRRRASTAYDLRIAHARTLAAIGILLDALGISHRGADAEAPGLAQSESSSLSRCPSEIPRPLPGFMDAVPSTSSLSVPLEPPAVARPAESPIYGFGSGPNGNGEAE